MEIPGPREIHQRLYYAIEAPDFAVEDIHVTPRIGFLLDQLVAEQLQMKHDCVYGILDLMGHAAREASTGREAARHFNFIANALHRFAVAHDQQSANL